MKECTQGGELRDVWDWDKKSQLGHFTLYRLNHCLCASQLMLFKCVWDSETVGHGGPSCSVLKKGNNYWMTESRPKQKKFELISGISCKNRMLWPIFPASRILSFAKMENLWLSPPSLHSEEHTAICTALYIKSVYYIISTPDSHILPNTRISHPSSHAWNSKLWNPHEPVRRGMTMLLTNLWNQRRMSKDCD